MKIGYVRVSKQEQHETSQMKHTARSKRAHKDI
jgi:DNA invertase Pin-like site-specific DNA recombinase